MHRRCPLVHRQFVGGAAEGIALDQSQSPQHDVPHGFGEGDPIRRRTQRISLQDPELFQRRRQSLTHHLSRFLESTGQRFFDDQFGQERGGCRAIDAAVHLVQFRDDGHGKRVHANTALAIAVGVQQRALHVRGGSRQYGFLQCKLHGKGFVRVARRESQEIGGSIEEVAMERRNLHPATAADAYHRFPGGFADERSGQFGGEFDSVARGEEVGVVLHLAAGEPSDGGDGGEIGRSGPGSNEAIHGDLDATAFRGEALEEGVFGIAHERLFVRVHVRQGVSRATCCTGAKGCRSGLYEDQFPAHGAEGEEGGLERGSQCHG
mmetsp:Transcript_4560/g.8263  ORF Transcript_4560/g.8263 Transcript_4560/m.8263 type:complete len:321 (-) Transcript_4560:785-1747(-)